MFSTIWHTFFFDPIYNGLVFLIDIVPHGDIGVAIIVLTIVVKVALLPVSLSAARTQRVMREIEPQLKEIKERTKDDREALARETLQVYREAGVNPFSSILLLFIQIPIVIALYLAVYRGGGIPLPDINTALLYSFIPTPTTVTMLFLGIVDMAAKSLPLALLAGVTQFIQAHISFSGASAPVAKDAAPSFKDDFARSMQMQMKYVMPIVIFFFAYTISASVALYFAVSNILGIIQEYIVRARHAADTKAS
jgi:YidC/Oxa1 family membrane protein insertase